MVSLLIQITYLFFCQGKNRFFPQGDKLKSRKACAVVKVNNWLSKANLGFQTFLWEGEVGVNNFSVLLIFNQLKKFFRILQFEQ